MDYLARAFSAKRYRASFLSCAESRALVSAPQPAFGYPGAALMWGLRRLLVPVEWPSVCLEIS